MHSLDIRKKCCFANSTLVVVPKAGQGGHAPWQITAPLTQSDKYIFSRQRSDALLSLSVEFIEFSPVYAMYSDKMLQLPGGAVA